MLGSCQASLSGGCWSHTGGDTLPGCHPPSYDFTNVHSWPYFVFWDAAFFRVAPDRFRFFQSIWALSTASGAYHMGRKYFEVAGASTLKTACRKTGLPLVWCPEENECQLRLASVLAEVCRPLTVLTAVGTGLLFLPGDFVHFYCVATYVYSFMEFYFEAQMWICNKCSSCGRICSCLVCRCHIALSITARSP